MYKEHTCNCGCHNMFPILVILFAMLFLLGNMGYIQKTVINIIWPILVGLTGILKLGEGKCDCC